MEHNVSLAGLQQQRWGEDWLVGLDSQAFWRWLAETTQQLAQQLPCTVLIAERDPVRFLAGFLAASALECDIFLANPDWGEREWQQVWQQCAPDHILGSVPGQESAKIRRSKSSGREEFRGPVHSNLVAKDCASSFSFKDAKRSPRGAICIPTGGSSGQVTFAVHTWETLMASVEGFQQHFGVERVNAYCVLPLYHVSGLMQALRAFASGGKLAVQQFRALEAGRLALPWGETFISLVPTQLQRLLDRGDDLAWLTRFRAVLLGGAPAWSALLAQARAARIPLALTYGMTETASQVAALLPVEFLGGQICSGRALPHARLEIWDDGGHPLAPGTVGQICVYGRSLAWGYHLQPFGAQTATPVAGMGGFLPDDLGYLDEQGYLHVVGRNSTKIITGGEKVFPEEVEAVLRETALVADVCVVGLPDREWGQLVTAVYVPGPDGPSARQLEQALTAKLSRFKRPKHWIAVEVLPRNAQGKINRPAVVEMAQQRRAAAPPN